MTNKPKPKHKKWTNAEIKKLYYHYQEGGLKQARKALPNRTPSSIQNKAHKLMIYAYDQNDYVPLNQIHTISGNACSKRAIRQAQQAGALKRNKHGHIGYQVTHEWAHQYTQQLQHEQHLRHTTRHWHDTNTTAALLNIGPYTISQVIARALNPKPRTKGTLGKILITHAQPTRIFNNTTGAHQWKFKPQGITKITQIERAHMKCPNCKHNKTKVTRTTDDGIEITRNRKCTHCNHKYKTVELTLTEYKKALQAFRTNNPHIQ